MFADIAAAADVLQALIRTEEQRIMSVLSKKPVCAVWSSTEVEMPIKHSI